jgi:thioredoxin 1
MIEILVFSDKSCLPCRKLKTLLDKHNVDYRVIDVDEYPETTVEYHISALPTLIMIDGGEIQKKVVGLLTKGGLDDFLKI